LLIFDIAFVIASSFLAYYVRYDFSLGNAFHMFYTGFISLIPIYILITVVTYTFFGLYRSLWQYASFNEYFSIIGANTTVILILVVGFFFLDIRFPKSILVLTWFFNSFFCTGIRMGYRGLRHIRLVSPNSKTGAARTLVIGAGEAGALALQEMKQHANLCLEPVAIVDDDKDKHGKKLFGVPVVGDRNNIHQVVERFRIDQIVIAIPSASEKDINDIISICKRTKCKLKTLPGVFELLNGNVTVNQIRDVQIEDLLGRKPVKLDIHNIKGFISNKTILVTGGGGSIGSELCRQIARFSPAKLLILDIYENGAYDLQMETTPKIPGFRYGSFNCICSRQSQGR
jgi:FlaA1/EpsC-like NDP-sugar epimerase